MAQTYYDNKPAKPILLIYGIANSGPIFNPMSEDLNVRGSSKKEIGTTSKLFWANAYYVTGWAYK